MTAPVASIIIPAYNAEATIGEQLEALLAQDSQEAWELLICDNGSTDRTTGIVAEYLSKFPSARLVDASHRRGAAAARNAGAREAAGRWLLFCDADDVVDRSWISDHLRALRHADLVTGEVEYERLRPLGVLGPSWFTRGPLVFRLPALPWLDGAGSGNLSVEREVFLRSGGFEERLRTAEDADLVWRLQLAGTELARGGGLCHIRVRGTLRELSRQAFAYGSVYRMLERRYAKVRGAASSRENLVDGSGADVRSKRTVRGAQLHSVLRRLSGSGDPQVRIDLLWGFFHRLGRQWGPSTMLPQVQSDGRIANDD